jgi:hypothetical protein
MKLIVPRNHTWIIICELTAPELQKWIDENYPDDAIDLFTDEVIWKVIQGNNSFSAIQNIESSEFFVGQSFAVKLSNFKKDSNVYCLWYDHDELYDDKNCAVYLNGQQVKLSEEDIDIFSNELLGQKKED